MGVCLNKKKHQKTKVTHPRKVVDIKKLKKAR
jgi:hypothetical protein